MNTKDRILDAAERLFAEHGFADTSLRQITAEADVNLAAVNYHFQSKDALIQAVFARRLRPMNQARLRILDEVERAAGDGQLPLEPVLRALIQPVLVLGRESACGRLFGRLYAEGGGLFGRIFREEMGEARQRFVPALRRALPELPKLELLWRIHFLFGAVAHTVAGLHHLDVISEGLCDPSDLEATLARILAFISAGLRAPIPTLVKGEQACEVRS